jgi:outer membrane autotransporter protein
VFGNGTTPAFDETDYGLTVGFRWDASRHFDLAPDTLTVGVIGNYTHSDIDVGTNAALAPFFDKTGSVDVDSWSAGAFGLVTDGRRYGLVTVTATMGTPETENFVLGSRGEFDTLGFTASAMSGVLIPVGSSTLDLRGGLTVITASGDDYTDSAGVRFSDAELEEFSGQVSARLFRVVRTEDGSFRPFIQGGLSQRFHYSNDVDVDGVKFSFEDADTSVFARAGVDFDINRSMQAYVSVRGDASESMEAIAAQVGLTFKLD